MEITIDTGLLRVPIIRDGEQVGVLEFNPSDQIFAERFYQLIQDLQIKKVDFAERANAIDAVTAQDELGVPVNAADRLAFQREVGEFMRSEIDKVFGAGTSQMVFGDVVNIAVIEQFLSGVVPMIHTTRQDKIQKYIQPRTTRKGKVIMK